ncbi:hypothetical protein [Pseudoflavonifractor phocaeensis]|uniref:hypothetical protein n=1 Tax=Pseudoflavonifractor phocaeensis TaxID=1870988 RepID=UPI002FF46649
MFVIDGKETWHCLISAVGFELRFTAYPISTFFGDGFLRKLVAQADLKFTAMQSFFACLAGNIEFPFFL